MAMTPKQLHRRDRCEGAGAAPFGTALQHTGGVPSSEEAWLRPEAEPRMLPEEDFDAIVDELTASWERGQMTHVEAFLDRIDSPNPADIVELIYHEFCLAESKGLAPDPTDYLRRFPDNRERLHRLFLLHDDVTAALVQGKTEQPEFPYVGDEVGPFLLKRTLGIGATSRVFLAEQEDLDRRLVVVKISTRRTPEPTLLARARHAHIVEVLWHGSVHAREKGAGESGTGKYYLITMPFLGGAPLTTVLDEQRRRGGRPRTGNDLLAVLDAVSAPEYPKANLARPAREIIAGLSYPAAVAWMFARLAEALDHASQRGVVHGDIKPSNILLTSDGTPMLLDFNLAAQWRPEAESLGMDQGGTLEYMAPERLRAMAGWPSATLPTAADRLRADVFSLGVVLLEVLTNHASPKPVTSQISPRLELAAMFAEAGRNALEVQDRLARASIPRGLRSILERCLAPDGAKRYHRAAELADDLDRWRTGRPLAFADEPPWPFRLARWAKRQRLALGAAVAVMVVCTLALTVLWTSFQTTLRRQAEDKLALIWDREESGVFPFHRFGHWTPDDLGDRAARARRYLDRYNVVADPDWRRRNDVRSLAESERAELELWLLEQTFQYAKALGDRPDSTADWARALTLLDQAIVHTAPYSPLLAERRRLQKQLKPSASASLPARLAEPEAWIEEYLLGVVAEPMHAREAQSHYDAMLRLRPHSFWGHYRAATVAYRLGEQAAAVAHLRACIAQRPKNVNLRAQLVTCLFLLGRYEVALDECSQALSIDPDHAVSTRNLSFVRGRLGRGAGVDVDVRRFELLTQSQSEVLALKIRLEAMLSQDQNHNQRPAGTRLPTVAQLVSADNHDLDGRILRASQLRNLKRYDEALTEFDAILDQEPEHLEARFYRAMLLRKLGRPQAEAEFHGLLEHPRIDELVAQYNDAINIYDQHSSDLLHAGEPEQAIRVARDGLTQANRFKWRRAESHYALARAYAVAARTNLQFLPEVREQLKQAAGFSLEKTSKSFERDSCFDGLRDRFRSMLADHY